MRRIMPEIARIKPQVGILCRRVTVGTLLAQGTESFNHRLTEGLLPGMFWVELANPARVFQTPK